MKVLIADDSAVVKSKLSAVLKEGGYEVVTSSDGLEALNLLLSDSAPDLAIIDRMMPGLDGTEVCRRFQAAARPRFVYLILLTSLAAKAQVIEGLNSGANDYVTKPCDDAELLARVRIGIRMVELHRALAERVVQLSKADAAKNRFLGMAAHDLRNPLSSIGTVIDLLRDGTVGRLTQQQIELLDIVGDASRDMLELVHDLLDIATIESGSLNLELTSQDLRELVEKSVRLAEIEAAKKKTIIQCPPEAQRIPVQIDVRKMRQVVDNLLSNAVKYSPPGSTITVELCPAAGTTGPSFAVKDEGPGIPQEEHHKLFNDYGRLSTKPTGGENSTGLGLAICRKIAEAHGASITATNLPTRGCEFRVRFASTRQLAPR